MMGVTACYEDESSYANLKLNDIVIEETYEETYTVESFAGQYLDIPLTISGGFQPDELTYEWKLTDPLEDKYNKEDYEPLVIGTDKDLHYEVNLKPGTYHVTCQVTSAEYGYAASFMTQLITKTSFSQGFYILKETAGGDTELDFFNTEKAALNSNILATTGNCMKGKPGTLSISYANCYVNENDEADGANLINVSTLSGDYKGMRSLDLRCVSTRENLCYEEMADGEYVIGQYRGMLNNWLITNCGFRGTYAADVMPSKGFYGVVSGEGASQFFTYDYGCMTHYLWDETHHHLISIDFSGGISDLMPAIANRTEYECLSAGLNLPQNVVTYLFKDNEKGTKVLYQLNSIDVMDEYEADLESHLAKGNLYTTNARQAAIMYVVDGGKLYAHSLQDHSELEYQLKGLPAGTDICYISNQYLYEANGNAVFDYLVIGSQNGSKYTLYMYETLGGVPNGTPVRVIEGEGKLKSVRYLALSASPGGFPYTD